MFAAGGDVSMLSPVRRYGTMLESPVNLLNRKAGLNQTLIYYILDRYPPAANMAISFELHDRTDLRADFR